MAIATRAQIGIFDQLVEDEELAATLASWSAAKDALANPREKFVALDKKAKGAIAALKLAPGDYRCGRFVVAVRMGESKEVTFERTSKAVIRIRRPKDDE